jgi:hypothetical protein
MKRFVTLALVGALVLGTSSIVYANVCAFDAVPAATLLFPFVALDYNSPTTGTSTTFSITNVSSEAQIVHVTVWTDFSSAILDFNILLTGYDVISMNIRDIFINGNLPVTVSENHDENEGVFPTGPVSPDNTTNPATWIANLLDEPQPTSSLGADRCSSTSPGYPGKYLNNPIPPGFLSLFQGYLQVSQTVDRYQSDSCLQPFTDGQYTLSPEPFWAARDTTSPTWMYITADVVQTCNLLFPDASLTYWVPAPDGEARYDNVLIGDVFWTNTEERFSEASNAVHLEADPDLGSVATTGPLGQPVSFYHRYAALLSAGANSDYREPLPTAWAFRYLGAGIDNIGTDIRVWKGSSAFPKTYDLERTGDAFSPDSLVASDCHAYTYYAWDEEENVTTVSSVPWSQPGGGSVVPNLIPLETQEIPVDELSTPGAFGWMLFVWPASNYPPGATDAPDDFYQTWMGVKYNAADQWSAGMDAAVMANWNCFSDQYLPNLGVNYSYVDPTGYVVSPGNNPPTN